MKRKVLFCALVVMALLFSVQPASAQREVVIEGVTRLPVINVIVPGSSGTYINPLELPVWVDNEESNAQVISPPSYIANASEVPLKVDVTITTKIWEGSDMTLSFSPTQGKGTLKQAFVYFEMHQSSSDNVEDFPWDASFDSMKHIRLTTGDTGRTKKGIVTLPAMTLDGEIAENGYAPFRLAGDAAKAPTKNWDVNDGLSVNIAFTFTPLPYSEN